MSDTIDRQAAIDAIEEYFNGLPIAVHYDMIAIIHNLPPAQPAFTDEEIQKMQDMRQAEVEKAFELGREDANS